MLEDFTFFSFDTTVHVDEVRGGGDAIVAISLLVAPPCALAETGRAAAPNNVSALPKRPRLQQWDELGLGEMSSEEERSAPTWTGANPAAAGLRGVA